MKQMFQFYFMLFQIIFKKLMQQQSNTNNIKQQILTVDELLKKVAKSRQRDKKDYKEKNKKAAKKVIDNHQGAIKQMEIIQQQNIENSEQFDSINNDPALILGRLNPNQVQNVPNNEENNVEQHLVDDLQVLFKGKVESKWKRQPGQKKGRFSPEQQRIINKAVGQFLVLHQIKYDDFISQIADKNFNKSVLADLDFYNKISSLLPNRSTYSCYKYLRRNYQKQYKKGKWSVQQQTKLLSLVEKYGKKWNQIAKKMERYPADVSLKYQTLGCQNAKKRVKGRWTFYQLVNLLKLVQKSVKIEFLDKTIQNELANETQHNMKDHNDYQMRSNSSSNFQHHNNRIVLKYMRPNTRQIPLDMISWSAISKKIKTRSMIDCRNKFFQLFESTLKGYKVKNEGIINFIDSQNIIEECQINWQLWQGQDMTSQQAKNRFLFLKKLIKSKAHTPFVDQLVQLKKIIKNNSKN